YQRPLIDGKIEHRIRPEAQKSCVTKFLATAAQGNYLATDRGVHLGTVLVPERSTADPARKTSHHRAPFVAGLAPSQLQAAPVPYSNFLLSAAQLPRN